MSKALIAYASMSGNTEDIAMIIKDTLREYGFDVTIQEMDDVDTDSLAEYDLLLIGTYTWGTGIFLMKRNRFTKRSLRLTLKERKRHASDPAIMHTPDFAKRSTRFTPCLNEPAPTFIKRH